jgi:hypothetical protein
MTVFVLFRNVPYEFGEVLGVFKSKKAAFDRMTVIFEEYRNQTIIRGDGRTVKLGLEPDLKEYEIQEWTLDGGQI